MKNLFNPIIIILFTIFFYSCGFKKIENKENQRHFANITSESYVFKVDTVKFKRNINKSILGLNSDINFDKIEIIKQVMRGTDNKDFYYLKITDFEKNIVISRWLNKVENGLYLNDDFKDNRNFEKIYLICEGIHKCNPNVYMINAEKNWVCGENPSCSKDSIIGCKTSQAVIFPD